MFGLHTYFGWLGGAAISIYVDNEEVRYSLISGTSRCKGLALMIARMWQVAAIHKWELLFRRAETKSNLADGPTRDEFKFLIILKAIWCSPALPDWLHNLLGRHSLENWLACV